MSDIEAHAQQRHAGRPCVTCTSLVRADVEAAILSGELLSAISSEFTISTTSLRRHRDQHMQITRSQMEEAGLTPQSITLRLAEVAERAREAALEAQGAGRTADMIRSGDGERRALETLLALGVKHEKPLRDLAVQQGFFEAFKGAVKEEPHLGELLARHFDRVDAKPLADSIRTFVSRNKEIER